MIVEIINHKYQYEAEKLTRIFYPNEKITVVSEKTKAENETILSTEFTDTEVLVSFFSPDKKALETRHASLNGVDDREWLMASLMYEILVIVTGYKPKWGILTGIRPSKLLRSLEEKHGKSGGTEVFREKYFVNREKTELADSVADAEKKIISLSRPESFSLYVSIPFCPTRCSYCSFVSHAMTNDIIKKLMPDYLDKLIEEIKTTGEIARRLNLRAETVYYGGGTPTTLSAPQLERLMAAIRENFDLSYLREYTIEAGRPDTVTRDKLKVMKSGGVSRISINPQTFDDEVLKKIGRCHSAQDAKEAFFLAREEGFDNINMDLIAGLPGDTYEGFCNSVDIADGLNPENITVHTLALKRSSYMGEDGRVATENGLTASRMLDYTYLRLKNSGYHPYYMYRQSKSLGNLENTGYCLKGRECLYNIFMMEECHTILAVGAGAVTKLKAPNGTKIDRVFNFKYPQEYIRGFDEIINRKSVIIPFYSNNK